MNDIEAMTSHAESQGLPVNPHFFEANFEDNSLHEAAQLLLAMEPLTEEVHIFLEFNNGTSYKSL